MSTISRRTALISALGASAATLAGIAISGPADAAPATPACRGGNLSGSFVQIPGSGAAGHIGYRLTVKDKATHKCFLKGLPKVRLLDKHGHSLPSHVVSAGGASHKVVILPGHTATADARISDIPSAGDHQTGKCQPTAFKARVGPRPGGGKTVVAVTPHTSVCGKGTMRFHPFVHGP